MLDIKNMSDDDKLFNFMSGLQPWAQVELWRQCVKDLPSAMVAADSLVDYKLNKISDVKSSNKPKSKGKGKKKFEGKVDYKNKESFIKEKQTKYEGQGSKSKFSSGCFLCDGPHRARDCPRKEKLNTLVAGEMGCFEPDGEGPIRVNPIQLLSTIREVAQTKPFPGLLYVKVVLNSVEIYAMIDTGASHNFVNERIVGKFGLKIEKHTSKIKVVNADAQPVQGVARDVLLQVGAWKGQLNLMIVSLDDFDVIFGIDFLTRSKAVPMPHLKGLMFMGENQPCFVFGNMMEDHYCGNKGKNSMLSTMQISDGLRKGDTTYIASLVELKPYVVVEVVDEVADLLKEFADVMPSELPRILPPRRAIDHKIDIVPGSNSPS
ncbi:gag-asp_proteas domain-containing protein [Cephalotus follicularis]|uniref:Gag-asp_proteas domain-containing protein n=1 Tax=Cephalotus follicularis TaxID=3775 RepID=A0A1Q3CW10_CEPFO|nr:gag-asp_proteas domain-containing protein [Cephalotus follicularis]